MEDVSGALVCRPKGCIVPSDGSDGSDKSDGSDGSDKSDGPAAEYRVLSGVTHSANPGIVPRPPRIRSSGDSIYNPLSEGYAYCLLSSRQKINTPAPSAAQSGKTAHLQWSACWSLQPNSNPSAPCCRYTIRLKLRKRKSLPRSKKYPDEPAC